MIYTLTFNPSLDYIVTVPKFTCGMVNRTTEEIIFPGGKGINVSMVLKNLGFENTALGFYAGFTGMELKRLVADKGIHAEFIPVDKGMTRINVKLRSEQESEINGQGPAIAASDIDKLYEKLDALCDGDILVMAGSIPDVMPQTMYMDIMKHLQGRNLKIVVDATRDLLVNVLPFHPFLIKPNNHELGEIFGVEICEKEDVVTYAKKLQGGSQKRAYFDGRRRSGTCCRGRIGVSGRGTGGKADQFCRSRRFHGGRLSCRIFGAWNL